MKYDSYRLLLIVNMELILERRGV